jgi:predicted nuclease with TOPRIM domain
MDIQTRIQNIKTQIKTAEKEQATLSAQKEFTEQQLENINNDMIALNVTPDTIEEKIKELKNIIETQLTELESNIEVING